MYTHLVVVGDVDDDGQLALVGAVVDKDHAPDLHKASETLRKSGKKKSQEKQQKRKTQQFRQRKSQEQRNVYRGIA